VDALGLLTPRVAPGRKRVRWRAEHVIHFAWSTAPDYIYEGGRLDNIAIHVLYQPGDTAWANNVAVQRTADALAFYGDLFGKYPYPQITIPPSTAAVLFSCSHGRLPSLCSCMKSDTSGLPKCWPTTSG
jgi:hypothetical protein